MPGPSLQTIAFVLAKQPSGSDSFEQLTVFSGTDGLLHCLRRVRQKTNEAAIDLFDEVELWLESSNQGRTWFIKEHRFIQRHDGIGRSYDTLRAASAFAALIVRNSVPDESRDSIVSLLRSTLTALSAGGRPDITWLKALYSFLRDEGYPVKQQWWPALSAEDRESAATLLNQPLSVQTATPALVTKITAQLEKWIQTETEIHLR